MKKLQKGSTLRPTLALVLGSGFQYILRLVEVERVFSFIELPGFPSVRVKGHINELILGKLAGTPVVVVCGRPHFYEGHSMSQVTYFVRVLAAFGVKDLLLTNAAGGINESFRPGDFMLLTDHINFMGENPLRGPNPPGCERFVSLTRTYSPELSALISQAAERVRIILQRGVYLAVSGPSYETPAEIRAFGRLGADAVGMSTVPEAIVARLCGLNVAGLSCITNLAAGLGEAPELYHKDVLDIWKRVGSVGVKLLDEFARLYAKAH